MKQCSLICNLRTMEEKDLPITFAWRNDEEVLKAAMTSNPISYQEHEAMFKFNNSIKLVFEVNNIPSGYVSCTVDPDEPVGTWGFHLSSTARKKGYSEIMLRMALLTLKQQGYKTIIAEVRPSNLPSLYLHTKLRFKGKHSNNGFNVLWLNL